jgi:hypothetical protein
VNLAFNKAASASTTRSSSYAASKAVDGSRSTSWMSSTTKSAQWVQVDLGSSLSISQVRVFWPATYYAKAFRIETSADGSTWTSRYSTSAGNGSVTKASFAPVNARYVRVYCTTRNNSSYYGVAELEVYAVRMPNQPPVAAAGPDRAGLVGQALSFSGAASSDADGTVVSYSWNWGDGTADGSGISASHTYAGAGTYTGTLTVTDDGGATASDTAAVAVSPVPVNLALNKSVGASSIRSTSYTAEMAVDGNLSTSWMSGTTKGDQVLLVDLGSTQSISNVKVIWKSTYFAKGFRIETMDGGAGSWITQYTTSSGNGGTTNAVFASVNARWVQVTCTARNGSYYGISELEVYR